MVPDVIGSRPSTIRAIVDLPDPDSPTIVTTSFSSRVNETFFDRFDRVLAVAEGFGDVLGLQKRGHADTSAVVVVVASSGSFSPCT